jgi:hypothetical protein
MRDLAIPKSKRCVESTTFSAGAARNIPSCQRLAVLNWQPTVCEFLTELDDTDIVPFSQPASVDSPCCEVV